MHRPGRRAERLGDRAARERTPGRRRRRASSVGRPGIAEPTHRVAVEVRLVDRLARAGVAQLGRAIGGAHDQRNARVRRLHDRGMEVRGRGTRRAQHHRRAGRSRGRGPSARNAAERSSSTTCTRSAAVAGERERERRRARSGRDDRVGHARARPLVDQRRRERRGGVASGHRGPAARARMRPWPDRASFSFPASPRPRARGRAPPRSCASRATCDALDVPPPTTFAATARAIGVAGGRARVRRLLDGRPAVPAARARPARSRARRSCS